MLTVIAVAVVVLFVVWTALVFAAGWHFGIMIGRMDERGEL